jgi:hypothetical protein
MLELGGPSAATPGIFDPAHPGIDKQTMLDWLRNNHPETFVESNANEDEVAAIVRKVQPGCICNVHLLFQRFLL